MPSEEKDLGYFGFTPLSVFFKIFFPLSVYVLKYLVYLKKKKKKISHVNPTNTKYLTSSLVPK